MVGKIFIVIRIMVFVSFILSWTASNGQANNVIQINPDTDEYYLKSFLQDCGSDNKTVTDAICDSLSLMIADGEFTGKKQGLYKVSMFSQDTISNLHFVSKMGNYATNIHLYYRYNNTINHLEYRRDSFQKDNDSWFKEAVLQLPTFSNDFDFYIVSDYLSWEINEWYILTEKGYNKHKSLVSNHTTIYLTLVTIFLIFTLIGYLLFVQNVFAYYAFYLFATSLYIFKELNALSFQTLTQFPSLVEFLNESIYGVFILSFLLYIDNICDKEKSPFFQPILYKVLIYATVINIIFGYFLMNTFLGFMFISLISYGATFYFIVEAYYNYKNNTSLKWFLLGTSIMVVFGMLIDLHVQGLINFPSIYYWIIPGLVVELLLIGVGVIYGIKQKSKEFSEIKQFNTDLNQNVSDLERKISHSLDAYQTLVAKRGSGDLNLPSEYFDFPLTQREIQVIQFLNHGYNNRQLAQEMYISRNTVKTHLKNIYKKLDVNDREAALEKMRDYGII